MVQFLKGQATAIAMVPTIRKPDYSKSGHFCPDFKWVLTKWQPFVGISDPIQNSDYLQTDLLLTIQNPVRISDPHCI